MSFTASPNPVELALEWLVRRGYSLVVRKLQLGRVPIHVVMKDGPQTVFVEVKTLSRHGGAVELVTRRRAQQMIRAIGRYLAENPAVPRVRIDVVTVTRSDTGSWELEHYINAVP